MPGLGSRSSQQEESADDEPDMETLSTGLENFDEAIERQGIRLGSLIAVTADPASPGDTLAANMIANRPAYYYSFTKSEAQIRRNIKPIDNVELEQVHIHSVDSETPIDTLRNAVENAEFPRGVTIIIDPVNVLEAENANEYKSLLRTLNDQIVKHDGLGILYGVNPETEPENRWMTTYTCDTVLEVMHRTSDETITDYLAVQKLYPGQSMIDEDSRVFELTPSLNMDIATSRNISP